MIQLQFLNYVLETQDASIFVVYNLSEQFFSEYKEEYTFISRHIEEYGRVPDKETFLIRFQDFDIIEVKESLTYLLSELYRDYNRRNLTFMFNKIRSCLMENRIEDAEKLYYDSLQSSIKMKPLKSFDLTDGDSRYNDYIDKCKDFSKFYVKTGFKELDRIIGGWDRNEELATIAARPGVGKSWVLLKCAVAALEQGLRVGIYSGEMSERKVGYRFDTLVSHISNYSITKGVDTVQNEYKMYIDSLKEKFKGTIKVITPNSICGAAGVNALRAFIESENLDILFVDQHSLLEDDRRAKNPVDRAANISRDLKNLQVLKKIPIVAVSQQNRTDASNGATTSNIAQSDRIAQDSTIVIFLEQKDGVMTFSLVKSRDSETNKQLKYAVDLNKGIFNYIPDGNSGEDNDDMKDVAAEFEEDVF